MTTRPFDNPEALRRARAAMSILRMRDAECAALNEDAYDAAAGNLRAVQRYTGLTPQQICDALRIHGWRRKRLLPQSGGALRFRLSKADRDASRGKAGSGQSPVAHDVWEARPHQRQKLYRPREEKSQERPNEKEQSQAITNDAAT